MLEKVASLKRALSFLRVYIRLRLKILIDIDIAKGGKPPFGPKFIVKNQTFRTIIPTIYRLFAI